MAHSKEKARDDLKENQSAEKPENSRGHLSVNSMDYRWESSSRGNLMVVAGGSCSGIVTWERRFTRWRIRRGFGRGVAWGN